MKRLNTEKAIQEMEMAASGPDWQKWYDANAGKKARIEFPNGEVTNPKLTGFLWAWYMQGAMQTAGITERDKFSAQGLEGKTVVETSLCTALLAARELPKFRVAVYV